LWAFTEVAETLRPGFSAISCRVALRAKLLSLATSSAVQGRNPGLAMRCSSYSRQKRAMRKGSGIGKKSPPRPTGKLGERVSLLEALTSTERRVCGLGIRTLRKMCGAVRFELRAKDALSVAVFRKNVVVLWVANSAGPKATSEGSSPLVISSGGNNARAFKEAIIQGVLSVSAERSQPLSDCHSGSALMSVP